MDTALLIESPFSPLLGLLVGALLLFAGRRLFWFLVAAVGFLLGYQLASQGLGFEELWLQLLVAVVVGVAAAVLAVVLQRLAIGLAGFVIGGAAAAWFAGTAFGASVGVQWAAFVIGGLLAAVVAGLLFDAALVVLSALLGASFVVQALPGLGVELAGSAPIVAFLVLAAVGMGTQALGRPRRRRDAARRNRD